MNNRLEGKVAVITGASRGIGRGIASIFVEEGATVYLVARNQENLEQCAEAIKGNCFVYACDVSKEGEVSQLLNHIIEKENRIDILCHNAGIYPSVMIENMTSDDWDRVQNTNLKSSFLITKECLKYMKQANYGKIVIISSITGVRVGNPGLAHYAASKAGVNGFIKSAAIEYAKHNITINAVEPGNILTEGLQELGEEYIDFNRRSIPSGRLGEPEDVGYTCLFLSTDESRFITGQSIIVDGGQILPEYSMMFDNGLSQAVS